MLIFVHLVTFLFFNLIFICPAQDLFFFAEEQTDTDAGDTDNAGDQNDEEICGRLDPTLGFGKALFVLGPAL